MPRLPIRRTCRPWSRWELNSGIRIKSPMSYHWTTAPDLGLARNRTWPPRFTILCTATIRRSLSCFGWPRTNNCKFKVCRVPSYTTKHTFVQVENRTPIFRLKAGCTDRCATWTNSFFGLTQNQTETSRMQISNAVLNTINPTPEDRLALPFFTS